jgi:hypothetical protein
MNSFFLSLLSLNIERKKGKASIFYRHSSWYKNKKIPRGCQPGDIVCSSGHFLILDYDGKFKKRMKLTSIVVDDHNFNPNYWDKIDSFSFFLRNKIMDRILKKIERTKSSLVKIRIGKRKYKFLFNPATHFSLKNHKTMANEFMFRFDKKNNLILVFSIF